MTSEEICDDMCHCQVTLSETPVFATLPSREDVLSSLMLGAHSTSAFTDDNATLATYSLIESSDDVEAYVASDERVLLELQRLFSRSLQFGNPLHLKNMVSTITLGGLYTLRNLPNFIDLAAPELRDAEFEVVAFLMSLIHIQALRHSFRRSSSSSTVSLIRLWVTTEGSRSFHAGNLH